MSDIKKNLLQSAPWIRILYMVLFAVVCWVLGIVLTVLIVAQALFSLITTRDNENLRNIGNMLSIYFSQILQFLTYNTEHKPFPFANLPTGDADEEDSHQLNEGEAANSEVETVAVAEAQAETAANNEPVDFETPGDAVDDEKGKTTKKRKSTKKKPKKTVDSADSK